MLIFYDTHMKHYFKHFSSISKDLPVIYVFTYVFTYVQVSRNRINPNVSEVNRREGACSLRTFVKRKVPLAS